MTIQDKIKIFNTLDGEVAVEQWSSEVIVILRLSAVSCLRGILNAEKIQMIIIIMMVIILQIVHVIKANLIWRETYFDNLFPK